MGKDVDLALKFVRKWNNIKVSIRKIKKWWK